MFRAMIILVLVLSFLGIADSWYLAENALTGTPLTCDLAGLSECNTVAESPYSRFLGIPLALYGVAFYTLLFVFSSLLLFVRTRPIILSLLVFAGLGFIASLYFMFLQIFVIKATCIYCVTSAILSTLIFLFSYLLYRKSGGMVR